MSDVPRSSDTEVDPREDAPGARDVLALIEGQRRKVAESIFPAPTPIFGVWGCADLVGFGAIWLSWGRSGAFSAWGAAALLAAVCVVAMVVSVGRTARIGHGVEGPSRHAAITYGWCWPLALAGVLAFDIGLEHHGLPNAALALLWPASFLLVAAVLFLAGGVLWADRAQLALGIWSLAVAAASTFVGAPANFAVLSLAGGGGLLATALVGWLARSRS